MILRRFVQHVKEQNWFAVGLDIIVVIVGIFLGMQVTEWNEQRKESTREKAYLLQIKEDVLASLESGKEYRTKQIEYLDVTIKYANYSIDFESFKSSSTEFLEGLRGSLYNLNRHSYRRKTWQELINSGRYQNFSDVELRSKIDQMVSLQDALDSSTVNLDVYTRDNIDPWLTKYADVWQIVRTVMPSNEKVSSLAEQMPEMDLEIIVNDLEFRNMLAFRYVFLSSDLDRYDELEHKYEELIQLIDLRLTDKK